MVDHSSKDSGVALGANIRHENGIAVCGWCGFALIAAGPRQCCEQGKAYDAASTYALPSNPLVERLRKRAKWNDAVTPDPDCIKAADEIEWLQRDLAEANEWAEGRERHIAEMAKGGEIIIAERDRLRAALEKAADTFRDYARALELFGKPVAAEGLRIAEAASREALSGMPADGPAAIPAEETNACQSRWHTSSGPDGGVCPMCNQP